MESSLYTISVLIKEALSYTVHTYTSDMLNYALDRIDNLKKERKMHMTTTNGTIRTMPIEMTADQLATLERELFDKIKYEFQHNILPKITKRDPSFKDNKVTYTDRQVQDEVTAARMAVLMTDAAMDALYRSNRITISHPSPEPQVI